MAKEFEVYKDRASQYRWRLRADNNAIIADSSEAYVSKQNCIDAAARVKAIAPTAPINDHTGENAARRW